MQCVYNKSMRINLTTAEVYITMKKQSATKPEGHFAKHKKFYIIYMAALVVITVGLNIAARRSTAFAEWYSTHIYKVLVATVGMLVGLVPFSMY